LQGFTFWCLDLMLTSIQILHNINGFRCLSTLLSVCLSLFFTHKFRTMIQCHVIFQQLDVLSLYIWSSPL
jgi:hypothetical protein